MARSQDILSGIFRAENAARVSEETYRERILRAEPVYGDLLYSREGTYFGIAAEVPSKTRVCLGQRMILLRPDPMQVHFRFLRYWLNSPVLAAHVHGHRDGTVAERLNLPTIRSLPVPIPPLTQQVFIAQILGSLDDKIQLNRQMNETLEALARTIFKAWFVDFDPVRAKASGHQPFGVDADTSALFPDSFQDSPLGKIPKGWIAGILDQELEIIGGGTPKTSIPAYWNGEIPWFSVVDAPRPADVFVISTAKKITQAGLESSAARVLPVDTTIISARGTVGEVALVGVPMTINQSCYGLRGNNDRGNYFTYFLLRQHVVELKRSTHGTVFDTITRDTFKSIGVVIPPVELSQSFDNAVTPYLTAILSNLHESLTVAAILDTLLPKLILGEIHIKHADKLIEASP
jgi:type I restriction enzyme S subunit